jgi:hypothetical protein
MHWPDDVAPLVDREGSFFLQNTSPNWALFLRQPVVSSVTSESTRVVLSGDLSAFPFQDLVAFLGQTRWAGLLRVFGPGRESSLTIHDGEVRSAASDSQLDRIGEITVRLGYMTRAQLEALLAESPPSRIGKIMVERQMLKPHDLYRCLHEQVSDIFHAMMLTKEGTFVLLNAPIDEKALSHNLSLSMQGLLMESVRKIDELTQFRKKIAHSALVVSRKKGADGKLEDDEDRLLRHVDGTKSILELGTSTQVSEFDATRLVYRLLEGGYVSLIDPNAPRRTRGEKKASEAQAPSPEAAEVVETYSQIFKEIHLQVDKHGKLEQFVASASAALRGSAVSTSRVLGGMSFELDGSLSQTLVLEQYEQLCRDGNMGSEPLVSLKQALSDVMFFLLFQAGELLESNADEALAKRVKAMLQDL